MANLLQFKRNQTVAESKASALSALQTYLRSASEGEPAIARYTEGGSIKILYGISNGDGNYTIFDNEAIPSEVQAKLDEITDSLDIINGNEQTEGSIAKAEKDAKDYTDQQFDTINPYVSVEQVLKDSQNYSSSEADKYEFSKHTGDKDELQLTFTPLSPLALTVPETIGDIEQGTTCEELNGMPISQILDSILFKTIYPTVTNPSAGCSFASGFTNNALVEAGKEGPTDTNMSHTFNQGKVHVEDGVTPDQSYVGAETSTQYKMTYTPGAANGNAGVEAGGSAKNGVALDGEKMTVGTYTFNATVSYGAGELMKTSKGETPNPMPLASGGTVANPHPAGSVTSGNVSLRVTLPVFIDNAANGTFNKQALQAWGAMTFTGVAMSGQTAATPTQIKTPRKLQSANSFNAVSGKYDVAQLSNYSMQETNENVNGVSVKYYLYKWNGGALDAVKFEIKTY